MRIFLEREMCRQARPPSLAAPLNAIAPDITSILPSLEVLAEVPRVSWRSLKQEEGRSRRKADRADFVPPPSFPFPACLHVPLERRP